MASFDIADPDMNIDDNIPTLDQLADRDSLSDHDLARKLVLAIRLVAQDMYYYESKKYCYEEWVEFIRLIRFSAKSSEEMYEKGEGRGIVEWDWIGENSPMLSDTTEPEWILDRLCESLNCYTKKQARIVSNQLNNSFLSSSRSILYIHSIEIETNLELTVPKIQVYQSPISLVQENKLRHRSSTAREEDGSQSTVPRSGGSSANE
jgi:hypothetical protein